MVHASAKSWPFSRATLCWPPNWAWELPPCSGCPHLHSLLAQDLQLGLLAREADCTMACCDFQKTFIARKELHLAYLCSSTVTAGPSGPRTKKSPPTSSTCHWSWPLDCVFGTAHKGTAVLGCPF